ncbi:dienelactone hydrolase family protein [Acuticoccus sp. M5D2P5]|uniref:dienelactone hydrolase family protein n=1 Tax=Acuticoccus kalidii TaxID=2910977 RepID=UPI001F16BC11|nr:dienelactone hydrolase family protein [Acuticoccus kalidii]MCF3934874.1 dienelactone hydrolase family protein [Acuticoccus kalidii]
MEFARSGEIMVRVGDTDLRGSLEVPEEAEGIVVFAHGSGSSRHSPRNRFVARVLRDHGLGTLLIDLLTEAEEVEDARTAHLRFDIPLLAGRLQSVGQWTIREADRGSHRALGYFGASTGAAAALIAAARQGAGVAAVVSRGGRPDLATDALAHVVAPTLLIVGGSDTDVLALNRAALRRLNARSRLLVVPGATHLFEETGALKAVAEAAAEWFAVAFADALSTEGSRTPPR